jgi:ribosomal-protein-alanine N-acetyltransferase
MIQYGFEGLGLNRIEAFVMPENLASMNALRKLGFREEGVLREYGFWKGQFVDLKCFSLLKREYKERDAPSSATAA